MGDLDLAPLDDPDGFPSLGDLREMDARSQAAYLTEWFLFNFEGPEQHTPRDDGDFVYVWGGPYDARDQLSDVYDGIVADEALDLAVERIERIGFDWVPHDRRIVEVPEYPDDDRPDGQHYDVGWPAEVRSKIDELKQSLAEVRAAGFGKIGHNNPPEPINEEPLSGPELDEIDGAADVGLSEAGNPEPSAEKVRGVLAAFNSAAAQIVAWAAKKADLFVDAGMKVAGGVAGAYLAAQLPDVFQDLLLKLQEAAAVVAGWLPTINIPF